jgi:hypothetical protein
VSSIGIGGFAFLLFAWAKIAGKIHWSWWWVTAPLWLPLLLLIATMAGFIGVAAAVT